MRLREAVMSAPERKLVHSDIKPANPPERAAHYLDVPNMPWEATKFPGIQIKVLYTDEGGITTALFKLAPGAVVPLHEHTALEQTYVIEGSLEDHEGKCGPVRLATGRQSARGGGAEWRGDPWLLPEAQSLRLWREVLHRPRRAIAPVQMLQRGRCRRCRRTGPSGLSFPASSAAHNICLKHVREMLSLPTLFGHPENVGENHHGISGEATGQIPGEGLSQA